MRAAQYLRMSTEHQQYSIENQKAAIEQYAQRNQLHLVAAYIDAGKSGLDLAHRPGLRALLEDVRSGRAEFSAVLVLDVSRWGRFQDSDEAAHYEFLCKQAGISVHYCTEPFSNDTSLASALFKTLKRTMAAEYSRELSGKVFAGQCRLARNGFKLGGAAGYGLRRLLLDSHNNPKLVLKAGERKNVATERVLYTMGPDQEVQVVREIYSMFLNQHLSINAIVRLLNSRGTPREVPGPWRSGVVSTILTHPKYTGCIVLNQTSLRLKSKRILNPREQWVVQPNCFAPIVSAEVFERARPNSDRREVETPPCGVIVSNISRSRKSSRMVQGGERPTCAAQYLRMSKGHQTGSLQNQAGAIRTYADLHGFDIIRTYCDEGKSGLDLAHRPGLRKLLDDVLTQKADFKVVLVLDVSRWGRFQDPDESAHYEFLCKLAGVKVHYCAESFAPVERPLASLMKSLKRLAAAEYAREMSKRVFAGQCRAARNGYSTGGAAGFGLRRLLVDSDGNPKALLARGEQKSITADRVRYIAGPEPERQVVREIYSMFLDEGLDYMAIARRLNERRIAREGFGCWDNFAIRGILTHPKI